MTPANRGGILRSKVFPPMEPTRLPPGAETWPAVAVVECRDVTVFPPMEPARLPPGAETWPAVEPVVNDHDTAAELAWLWPFLPRLRQWVATELGNRAGGVSADRVVRDVVVEVFASDAAERPPTFEALTGVARDQLSRLLTPVSAS